MIDHFKKLQRTFNTETKLCSLFACLDYLSTYLWLYSPLLDLDRFFSSLIFFKQ
jgi:hypothetical protein